MCEWNGDEGLETRQQHRKSPRKRRHWGLRILSVLLVLIVAALIGGGIYIHKIYQQTGKSFNKMYTPPKGTASTKIQQGKPFSILFLGVDTGADGRIDRGNSDTLIVVTVNPKTRKTSMHSIPRDTLAEMIGDKKRNMQKLNAAYNLGKSTMAKKSVGHLLNVPIDYYVTMNMGGLKTIVNAVGGIDINAKMNVGFDGVWITKGKHHLNGTQALAYARMRYQDPKGDYGRQMRQQEVIKAVAKKLISPKGIGHYDDLLKALQPNVRTDINFNTLATAAFKYRHNASKITSEHLQGNSAWINGSSYQIAATNELNRVSSNIRKELGLKAEKVDNSETRLNALNPTFNGTTNQDFNTFGLDTVYYTENTY